MRSDSSRRGAIAMWALACLVLVTALTVTLARLAVTGSRQMIHERRYSQAEWFVFAGMQLAEVRLAEDRSYEGQIWDVSSGEAGGADAARIRISVSPLPETSPESREIQVTVDYPPDSPTRARVSRTKRWSPRQADGK